MQGSFCKSCHFWALGSSGILRPAWLPQVRWHSLSWELRKLSPWKRSLLGKWQHSFCKVKYWLSLARSGQGRHSGISKQASCRGLWSHDAAFQVDVEFLFNSYSTKVRKHSVKLVRLEKEFTKQKIKLWDFLPQEIVRGDVVSRFKGLVKFLDGRSSNEWQH